MKNGQQIADALTKEIVALIRTTVAETMVPNCTDKGDQNEHRMQEIRLQDALYDYVNHVIDTNR